ncbi:hypothetical protein [Xanthomonas campestris]|uniref:hypothetical protein n=1 Tax=Xanthomonas campestris TaxID=339 RepID=UPI002B2352CD|nr:hypothetical protein [Xanthomonas campestris]MEA9656158.1 hypothetical protein [Xanthomonas campestris pv. raphani]
MNRPPLLLLAHCTVFRYYIAIFRYYIALCDCIDVCCERHCVSYKTSRVLFLAAVAVVGVLAATATAVAVVFAMPLPLPLPSLLLLLLLLPCRCRCRCRCLRSLLSGPPYRSGKAGRYNPQGGAQGCATFL